MEEIQNIEQYFGLIDKDDRDGTVIDFYAKWCGPCKVLMPVMQRLVTEYPTVGFGKIDCDNEDLEEILKVNRIASLPTVCFYSRGRYLASVVGNNPERIRAVLDQIVSQRVMEKVNL
jgi:thioredoxin 1